MTEYLVIYEGNDREGWSAYSPDVKGCIAAGKTRDEVERLMREAITLYIEVRRDDGLPLAEPSGRFGYVAV